MYSHKREVLKRWKTAPDMKLCGYDAKFFNITMPEGTAMTVQDRAYTSPIWYTP